VRANDPLRDLPDAVRVLNGRSAVLLHDEGHRRPPVLASWDDAAGDPNPTGRPAAPRPS
jgi:hypothetical protein